jgi:hypothetical protein
MRVSGRYSRGSNISHAQWVMLLNVNTRVP